MLKKLGVLSISVAVILMTGCKPQESAQKPTPPANTTIERRAGDSSAYFKTQFQSESQFIVEAIASDLAEQIYYAAYHRRPDRKSFSVIATEQAGSPTDAPVYELAIDLDQKLSGIKLNLNLNSPIWSPAVYREAATTLARAVKLNIVPPPSSDDTELLSKLMDGTAATIEQQDLALSDALEKDFSNPLLHEQAGLLLGAFLLRDHSGRFFEIRSPLSRMTAHLAMARLLSERDAYGLNGKLAEAMILTFAWDQAAAMAQLKTINAKDNAVAGMVRALQMKNTGNFRLTTEEASRSPLESVAWFAAMADYGDSPVAWSKLSDTQMKTIDFVRAANSLSYSVEIGNQLMSVAIPLELQEEQTVYELTHKDKFKMSALVKALNTLPEQCFTGEGQSVHVQVIGWGQWANFLQRHLCHAVRESFHLLDWKLGVHDDAKEFAAQCDKQFDGLYLYPFVRRFNCKDVDSYHRSVDDGFKVTVATPHLVPVECWNYLCSHPEFAQPYNPVANPHVNEWHNHNPPPGTVYSLGPRFDHPSFVDRPDFLKKLEQMHEWAPYDCRIIRCIIEEKYTNNPTRGQAEALYQPLLTYSVAAQRAVARTVYDQPQEYEKLMLQAAEFDPSCYYDLSDFMLRQKNEEKAVSYMDKACELDPDAITVASHAEWRIHRALLKGQMKIAEEIADFAGEVYSYAGLTAKAYFFESTSNYDSAFEWLVKTKSVTTLPPQ